jgi:hypothetical protein
MSSRSMPTVLAQLFTSLKSFCGPAIPSRLRDPVAFEKQSIRLGPPGSAIQAGPRRRGAMHRCTRGDPTFRLSGVRLANLDRAPAEVRAVQLQQVEGIEQSPRLVPTMAEQLEGSHALVIAAHKLAVRAPHVPGAAARRAKSEEEGRGSIRSFAATPTPACFSPSVNAPP